MKYILLIGIFALCVVSPFITSGQSFTAFDADTSAFPQMKARFYAYTADRTILRPAPADFLITENGIPRTVTRVSCTGSGEPRALSAVLTVDVSGSMTLPGSDGLSFIEIAKKLATLWIDELPLDRSECAVTSFDDRSYLNTDFTTDKQRLADAISLLTPKGGTDYNRGLFLPFAGSLEVSKRGSNSRAIVFITDGFPDEDPDVPAIIAEAKRQQCPIYAVTLGIRCPDPLRQIAEQTGGRWFEKMLSFDQIKDVYRRILFEAQAITPCEVEWTSEATCIGEQEQTTVLRLLPMDSIQTLHYTLPLEGLRRLEFTPSAVSFIGKPPGSSYDTTLTITARNFDFTVTDIRSSNPLFWVSRTNFKLSNGQSDTLTVTFKPNDSSYTFSTFEVITAECPPAKFYANGGFTGRRPKIPTLVVTHPNGGEIIPAGSDTVITWNGILPNDVVRIEYSSDGGKTWEVVTETATGLRYVWHSAPKLTGDTYLVRVRQIGTIDSTNSSGLILAGHGDEILAVDVSADGGRIITGSRDTTAAIWDAATGALIHVLVGHRGAVTGVALSPDGTTLATSSDDSRVILWDAVSGAKIKDLIGHSAAVKSVSWSADGAKLLTSSEDNTAAIWDVSQRLVLQRFTGHRATVTAAAWSPDNKKIVTTSSDDSVKIWDAATGATLHSSGEHSCTVLAAAWSADGNSIATGAIDGTVIIWDAASGAVLRKLSDHKTSVSGVAWNGKALATSSLDLSVRIWDSITWQSKELKGHTRPVNAVAWRGGKLVSGGSDFSAIIWNPETRTIALRIQGHSYDVSAVNWRPDNRVLATGSWDNSVILWNAETGGAISRLIGHGAQITDIAFSPDGQRLATASADGKALVWDVTTEKIEFTLSAHTKNVNAVAWNPDGSKLLTASSDRKAIIWNSFTGQRETTIQFPNDMLTAAAWSPDGTHLALGLTDSILIYSLTQNNTVCKLVGLEGPVKRVAWSSDGTRIAGLASDKFAIIWGVNSCTEIIRVGQTKMTGLSWHPDASAIATSSTNSTIELWDPLSGSRIQQYFGHTGSAECVAWSPDGFSVASGSTDNTARIWRLAGSKIALQTDVSDNTWSIASPVPDALTIDMGKVTVSYSKDSVVQNCVRNSGKLTFTVAGITFVGAQANEFAIVSGEPPFTLPPNSSKTIEIHFRPKSAGIRLAEMLILLSNGDTLRRAIRGEGVSGSIAILEDIIDFGAVEIGGAKDSVVMFILRNNSPAPLNFDMPEIHAPDSVQFSVKNPAAFTLEPFASVTLELRFVPVRGGRTNGLLSLPFNGFGSPAEIQLFGEGVAPLVRIASDSGRPGQPVSLRIERGSTSAARPVSLANSYRARVSYRTDLLAFEGSAMTVSRQGLTETLDISGTWDARGNVIARLPVRVGLGADTISPLTLERFDWLGVGKDSTAVAAATENGTFKLLGVCYADGARLFSASGAIRLQVMAIQSDKMLLEVESVERGKGTLVVFNEFGREIMRPFDGELAPGVKALEISTSAIASGRYFFVLTTPSESIIAPVDILK